MQKPTKQKLLDIIKEQETEIANLREMVKKKTSKVNKLENDVRRATEQNEYLNNQLLNANSKATSSLYKAAIAEMEKHNALEKVEDYEAVKTVENRVAKLVTKVRQIVDSVVKRVR